MATIGGQCHGLIILPDNWNFHRMIQFNSGCSQGWLTNDYSVDEWLTMEKGGAVFLPAAGIYYIDETANNNENGFYWSSNRSGDEKAYYLMFYGTSLIPRDNRDWVFNGKSVRLVIDK